MGVGKDFQPHPEKTVHKGRYGEGEREGERGERERRERERRERGGERERGEGERERGEYDTLVKAQISTFKKTKRQAW